MSIDGRGSSPSRAAQDTISALKSERDRLKGQLAERTEERDRAQRIAVALEQELAEVQAGVNRLERDANQRFAEEFGAAAGAARITIADVQDLLSSVTDLNGDPA